MTEKQRLFASLFSDKEREVLDVKLCRGDRADLTIEDVCREMNRSLAQVRGGESKPVKFLDRGRVGKRKVAEVNA